MPPVQLRRACILGWLYEGPVRIGPGAGALDSSLEEWEQPIFGGGGSEGEGGCFWCGILQAAARIAEEKGMFWESVVPEVEQAMLLYVQSSLSDLEPKKGGKKPTSCDQQNSGTAVY